MPNFYCEYCGLKFDSVWVLTAANCVRHPLGPHRGRHKLYEGREKSHYTCKYCGKLYSSINSMTASNCLRHPDGVHKGRCAPSL